MLWCEQRVVFLTDPPAHPQMRSSTLACTSTSWARTQPSSAHLESRRPCAQISTTRGGSMVSAACGLPTLAGAACLECSTLLVRKRSERDCRPRDWLGWGLGEALSEEGCPTDPCPPADPSFIHAELIPDSAERNDDKLYFFFRERSAEAPQSPAVYARIGRICLVGAAGPVLPLSRCSPGSFSPAVPGVWG